jgi:flagellar biosynthesis protein FlhG
MNDQANPKDAARPLALAPNPVSDDRFGGHDDSTPHDPALDLGDVIPLRSATTPMSPTVIAVTSGKGGVGKTNISVNLAIALGRRGARVLAIDADLGLANMDIVMGMAPVYTTADLMRGDATIDEVILQGPENVWLLPGASGQHDLADLSDAARRELFAAVDELDARFDAIVVDTGAGVGSNAVGFAAAAKDIVLVVTPEPTSVADAYGMLKVLCTRCAVRRVRVLANMVASPAEGEQVFRRLLALSERFLNVGLDYLGAIPRDPAIGRAVMRGEPVITAYPRCPASLAFGALAETLSRSEARDDREGALRLFWRRLLRQKGA